MPKKKLGICREGTWRDQTLFFFLSLSRETFHPLHPPPPPPLPNP